MPRAIEDGVHVLFYHRLLEVRYINFNFSFIFTPTYFTITFFFRFSSYGLSSCLSRCLFINNYVILYMSKGGKKT
ncbi:hypothetical protein ACN38_g12400 [Penicillium nordicum]|uniref:Uncharacterized protein n=1 Tax=Penicillium nordicum TaxID=229535 RepID=A0A0M9W9W4_9EURO|nr:hypothetical protein ACN38_g12400 [Penicillium nordicum]